MGHARASDNPSAAQYDVNLIHPQHVLLRRGGLIQHLLPYRFGVLGVDHFFAAEWITYSATLTLTRTDTSAAPAVLR